MEINLKNSINSKISVKKMFIINLFERIQNLILKIRLKFKIILQNSVKCPKVLTEIKNPLQIQIISNKIQINVIKS